MAGAKSIPLDHSNSLGSPPHPCSGERYFSHITNMNSFVRVRLYFGCMIKVKSCLTDCQCTFEANMKYIWSTLGLGFSLYKWSSRVLLTHICRTFWCLWTKLSLETCAYFLFLSQVLIILCRASSLDALFLGVDGFLMFCFNQVDMHIIQWLLLYCSFFRMLWKFSLQPLYNTLVWFCYENGT